MAVVLLAGCERNMTEPRFAPPAHGLSFVLLAPGTVAQLSAGAGYTSALRTDGTVACWGFNGSGEATPSAGPSLR